MLQLVFFWWSDQYSGSTLPKVMGKIQKALSKIFIDFAIKTHLNLFFEIISHNYLLFSHIVVWFYNIFMILNQNNKNKSWKIIENFSF